jgi:hypothetical protein
MKPGLIAALWLGVLIAGCAMPQVEQRAGPFSQRVGPGGVQQSAGPFSQSVGGGGVRQTGSAGAAADGGRCEVDCDGSRYAVSCAAGQAPACQCAVAPYARCAPAAR